jgi:hypothetical protein
MGRVGKGWKIRVKKFHREIERGTGCVGFGFFFYLYLLSWFFVYIVVVQLVVVDDGQRVCSGACTMRPDDTRLSRHDLLRLRA